MRKIKNGLLCNLHKSINHICILAMIFVVTGCNGGGDENPGEPSWLTFFNISEDAGGVTISISGEPVSGTIGFGANSLYQEIISGEVQLDVTDNSGTTLVSQVITIEPESYYSALLYKTPSGDFALEFNNDYHADDRTRGRRSSAFSRTIAITQMSFYQFSNNAFSGLDVYDLSHINHPSTVRAIQKFNNLRYGDVQKDVIFEREQPLILGFFYFPPVLRLWNTAEPEFRSIAPEQSLEDDPLILNESKPILPPENSANELVIEGVTGITQNLNRGHTYLFVLYDDQSTASGINAIFLNLHNIEIAN